MSGKSSATEKRKFSFLRCAFDDRLGVNHVRWGEEKGKKGVVGKRGGTGLSAAIKKTSFWREAAEGAVDGTTAAECLQTSQKTNVKARTTVNLFVFH